MYIYIYIYYWYHYVVMRVYTYATATEPAFFSYPMLSRPACARAVSQSKAHLVVSCACEDAQGVKGRRQATADFHNCNADSVKLRASHHEIHARRRVISHYEWPCDSKFGAPGINKQTLCNNAVYNGMNQHIIL